MIRDGKDQADLTSGDKAQIIACGDIVEIGYRYVERIAVLFNGNHLMPPGDLFRHRIERALFGLIDRKIYKRTLEFCGPCFIDISRVQTHLAHYGRKVIASPPLEETYLLILLLRDITS